jgi:hypothetical protein
MSAKPPVPDCDAFCGCQFDLASARQKRLNHPTLRLSLKRFGADDSPARYRIASSTA